jgi:hypothetical protein
LRSTQLIEKLLHFINSAPPETTQSRAHEQQGETKDIKLSGWLLLLLRKGAARK